MSPASRVTAGIAGAAFIAFIAYKRESLSRSGAITAIVLGTICVAAGWTWAIVLISFFISGTLLSRYKSEAKSARTSGVVQKGGRRDAWQVLANGGIFAAAAAVFLVYRSPLVIGAGAGAIAAAAADTWATEIGVLSRRSPFSVITWKPVVTGQSGGVTWLGSFAGLLGAIAMAVIAMLGGWGESAAIAAIIGGIGGSALDSVLGGSIQERRWCDRCNAITERLTHDCGTTTRVIAGSSLIDNDAVNAISSAFGAFLGFLSTLVIW